MKTENNLEAKARFFALYWGVKCLRNKLLNDQIPPRKLDVSRDTENEYLELIPLSQISDEDLSKVEEITYRDAPDFRTVKESAGLFDVAMYLISKGYYVGDGTEIEYGWVKLKGATPMQIGSNSLRQTYSLSFTKVITAITDDYYRRFGGIIGIIIKPRVFIIMRNGRYFETFRFDKVDYLFNSMDVVELRKRLKEM